MRWDNVVTCRARFSEQALPVAEAILRIRKLVARVGQLSIGLGLLFLRCQQSLLRDDAFGLELLPGALNRDVSQLAMLPQNLRFGAARKITLTEPGGADGETCRGGPWQDIPDSEGGTNDVVWWGLGFG
jgi:hypothetical protein